MKCPVCKNTCKKSDSICPTCGFTELHVEFINVEEANAWERSVLRPCRALWNASQSMYETALKRIQDIQPSVVFHEENGTYSSPVASAHEPKKHHVSNKNTIYEDEYVRVTYSGIDLDEYGELNIRCVVENKSTRNIYVSMETATCNGWDITYYSNEGVVHVSSSSKCKSTFEFSKFGEKSEIKSLNDINEFRYTIKVVDTDSYDTLSEPDTYFYLDSMIKKKK